MMKIVILEVIVKCYCFVLCSSYLSPSYHTEDVLSSSQELLTVNYYHAIKEYISYYFNGASVPSLLTVLSDRIDRVSVG